MSVIFVSQAVHKESIPLGEQISQQSTKGSAKDQTVFSLKQRTDRGRENQCDIVNVPSVIGSTYDSECNLVYI